jgi:fido (protein-threonine AMPylation protein)
MFTVNNFYLNFPFSDRLHWRPEYFEFKSASTLKMLNILKESIESFKAKASEEDKEVLKDYAHYYKLRYVFEILNGENNISLDKSILEEFIMLEKIYNGEMNIKDFVKIQNLSKAIDFIFPDIFLSDISPLRFNEELAKEIHAIIGEDLFKQPGEYRVSEAMAAVENYHYLEAIRIETEMKKLFDQTRSLLIQHKGEPEILLKLASQFLVHFLTIHPFENGNGRVARLMISYLLASITVVPLSIFSYGKNEYLECLRSERTKAPLAPSNLASLLLESAFFELEGICKYLNIYPKMNISS